MFPGNKPVRRMGLVVDDNTLDIPAFRRRGGDGGLADGDKLEPNSLLDGDDAAWIKGYEFALSGPIYAGTNEIQRNVIAERVLGLPRR